MRFSARNQFQGTVTRITEGEAMAEISVKVGNLEFIAAITEGSVKNMTKEKRRVSSGNFRVQSWTFLEALRRVRALSHRRPEFFRILTREGHVVLGSSAFEVES